MPDNKSDLENQLYRERIEKARLSEENEILRRNIRDLEEQLHLAWKQKGE